MSAQESYTPGDTAITVDDGVTQNVNRWLAGGFARVFDAKHLFDLLRVALEQDLRTRCQEVDDDLRFTGRVADGHRDHSGRPHLGGNCFLGQLAGQVDRQARVVESVNPHVHIQPFAPDEWPARMARDTPDTAPAAGALRQELPAAGGLQLSDDEVEA